MVQGILTAFAIVGSLSPSLSLMGPGTPDVMVLLPQAAAEDDVYGAGMELRRQGSWEEALKLWERAAFEERGASPDPRIGIAFLEVVADHEAEDWYESASRLFFWAFSGETPDLYRPTLLAELQRTLPLLGEEEAEKWGALEDSSTAAIQGALRQYWIERDPTPTTPVNERLIEHWTRIQYARSHFQYATNSPYGTDDRGTIYVKYGEPGRRKSGFLGANEIELRIRVPDNAAAREAMRRYDPNPRYEAWVYDNLNPEAFTYFLFGAEDGHGPFRLVDGVRDLLPPETRTQASARYTPGEVPIFYYLELFYYRDLSELGGRFLRRFSELDELWNRYTHWNNPTRQGRPAPSENTLQGFSLRYQMEDRHDPESPPVEPVASEYEGVEREKIVVQTVRVLRDNEPRLLITAVSASKLGVRDPSGLRRQRLQTDAFSMRHELIVRDSLEREVGRLTQTASSELGDVSTFFLRHVDRVMHLTVTGQTLRATDSTPTPVTPPPFPAQVHVRPAAPLATTPDHLEISDLATGVAIPPNIDEANLPFPLLPTPQIWQQDPLRVYLEVYHLAVDSLGVGRFRADFRIVPLRQSGAEDATRGPVTLSVTIESEGPTFARPFSINLRDQKIGPYRVEVDVTDLVSGETKSRQVPLDIIG